MSDNLSIDPSIDTYIAKGFSHKVYRRDNGKSIHVRKIPMYPWKFVFTYADHARYLSILRKYMGKFLFPTEIIENSEYAYILEQEYIPSLRNITMDELNASENLRVQFLDLLSYNERMYRETGCSLDIFWKDALHLIVTEELHRYLSTPRMHIGNLTIVGDPWSERIVILDVTPFDTRNENYLVRLASRILNQATWIWLRRYFWEAITTSD